MARMRSGLRNPYNGSSLRKGGVNRAEVRNPEFEFVPKRPTAPAMAAPIKPLYRPEAMLCKSWGKREEPVDKRLSQRPFKA